MNPLCRFIASFLVLFAGMANRVEAQNPTCNCKDYVYLNEPEAGGIHKLEVMPDGSLVEVKGGVNQDKYWYPGDGVTELPSPHGLGFDLNGFLYIGETETAGSNIRRLTCDGQIVPASEFAISTTGIKQNIFSIGNTLYNNSFTGPSAADVCSQAKINQLCLVDMNGNPMTIDTGDSDVDGTINLWGLSYNKVTNTIYATSRLNVTRPGQRFGSRRIDDKAKRSNVWAFTPEEMNAAIAAGTCIRPLIGEGTNVTLSPGEKATPYSRGSIMGIVGDNSGNFYVMKSNIENTLDDDNPDMVLSQGAYLMKYNAAGEFIAQSAVDDVLGSGGYYFGMGITYSAVSDKIYASNFSGIPDEDCIATFGSNAQYEGTGLPNPATGGAEKSKAISVLTECCPSPAETTIDKLFCNVTPGEQVNLRSLLSCEGIVCEGIWTPAVGNVGLVYNDCDQSVTLVGGDACGEFVLQGTGGPGTLCGEFKVTVKIGVEQVIEAEIGSNQTVCLGDPIQPLTIISGGTSTTGPVVYQWQSSTVSCTDDASFADIPNANQSSYTPTSISATTYYRLVTIAEAECATGNCSETSNCITLTLKEDCTPPCVTPTPTGVAANRCGTGTVTLTASGCDATYPARWYSNQGLTTQVGTGNSFTTPSITTTTDYYVACVETATPTCKSTGVLVKATINPNPTISTGTPVCNEGGTAFEVGYTATPSSIITTSVGTVDAVNNKVTGVPSGQTVTITATLNGCEASTTATATCTIPCPRPNCGSVTVIKN